MAHVQLHVAGSEREVAKVSSKLFEVASVQDAVTYASLLSETAVDVLRTDPLVFALALATACTCIFFTARFLKDIWVVK